MEGDRGEEVEFREEEAPFSTMREGSDGEDDNDSDDDDIDDDDAMTTMTLEFGPMTTTMKMTMTTVITMII